MSKATSLNKRSIRIGKTGEAEREVRIGCNHKPGELALVAALFNGTPACMQAHNEQKLSLGIEVDGRLVICIGKAVEFRQAIIGMMNHNGHQRRRGFVDPSAQAKAARAVESLYAQYGWQPGDPIPVMA